MERKIQNKNYTTRLQKGGALLENMRVLVRSWNDGGSYRQRDRVIVENVLAGVNRILSAFGIVWEMDERVRLRRVLPDVAKAQITATIAELSDDRFAPALTLLGTAIDAYDHRPRRDRDVCTNIFDVMESVAKEVFQMPNDTFGSVLKQIRSSQSPYRLMIYKPKFPQRWATTGRVLIATHSHAGYLPKFLSKSLQKNGPWEHHLLSNRGHFTRTDT